MDNAVQVSGLKFSYNDLQVLRGLSIDIPRGKVVAILGGSGSGKSTLLKLIGGQLRPEAGTVTIEGKNVHQLDPDALYKLRLEIGMMFQTSGLFSDLDVYENIAFPIRENFDVPEALLRRLVLMKLHAVGLRGAHAMKPNDLSGGMTRRVALARAIATDPKLMMYDEPFAGLDPISLNQIVELIRTLNQALGLTSIVVTYDVKEALKVADYVYVIGDGALLGQGTPAEIESSEDPYLKQFVNALPDGPVRFHFPAPPLEEELGLSAAGPRSAH
ncbi:MAG TPA: ABC transporter ATP-binding protein [Burkholderiales bacterium]|nr:ABC transporter ATP-binding protein [Burkholderiales bacterium]